MTRQCINFRDISSLNFFPLIVRGKRKNVEFAYWYQTVNPLGNLLNESLLKSFYNYDCLKKSLQYIQAYINQAQ